MPPPDSLSFGRLLFPMPEGREQKPVFSDIPPLFLKKIVALFGENIVSGEVCSGSFSASAGFIFTLESGRRIFAKGNHPGEMSHGAQTLRQEIFVYETVRILKSVAPEYLGCVLDDDENGWMLGFWEYIPPVHRQLDLPEVCRRIGEYFHAGKDVSSLRPAATQNYISNFFSADRKWKRFLAEPEQRRKFIALFEREDEATSWLDRNLHHLCVLQDRLPGLLLELSGLIHGDLRSDNILSGSRILIADWPNACRGPVIFDLLFLFASLESQGSRRIEEHLSDFSEITGLAPTLQTQRVMAAGIAGFFAEQAFRAVPEKMPRLRWMQKSMLLTLLFFLARQGVIESIPRMAGQTAE